MTNLTKHAQKLRNAKNLLGESKDSIVYVRGQIAELLTHPFEALRLARLAVEQLEDVCDAIECEERVSPIMASFDAAISSLKAR